MRQIITTIRSTLHRTKLYLYLYECKHHHSRHHDDKGTTYHLPHIRPRIHLLRLRLRLRFRRRHHQYQSYQFTHVQVHHVSRVYSSEEVHHIDSTVCVHHTYWHKPMGVRAKSMLTHSHYK